MPPQIPQTFHRRRITYLRRSPKPWPANRCRPLIPALMDAQLNMPGRAALFFCARGMVIVAVVGSLIHGRVMTAQTAAQAPPPAGMQQGEPAAYRHSAEEQAAGSQALGFLGDLVHG